MNRIFKIKICKNCRKEFKPTSNHKNCPSCRHMLSKTPCITCRKLCGNKYLQCGTCCNRIKRRLEGIGKSGKFYYYLRKSIDRSKLWNLPTNLDEDFLNKLWEDQEGRCVLTGIEIELSIYDWKNTKYKAKPWSASLDRIDSNLGYIKGNVQFVSLSMNYAKSNFSQIDFLKNLDDIVLSLSSKDKRNTDLL